MRRIIIPSTLWWKIEEIKNYLTEELKLSEQAALARIRRMDIFIMTLAESVDYPLCRFKKWRELGYRCAVFEKSWIFAYEIFDEGVIVRDMSHTSVLAE